MPVSLGGLLTAGELLVSDVDEDVTTGGIRLRGFGWGESLCKGVVGFADKLKGCTIRSYNVSLFTTTHLDD